MFTLFAPSLAEVKVGADARRAPGDTLRRPFSLMKGLYMTPSEGFAEAPLAPVSCHQKDCPQRVSAVCDRCGHSFCAEHVSVVTLERRKEQEEGQGSHRRLLTRIPTSKTRYLLCALCKKKPFDAHQFGALDRSISAAGL